MEKSDIYKLHAEAIFDLKNIVFEAKDNWQTVNAVTIDRDGNVMTHYEWYHDDSLGLWRPRQPCKCIGSLEVSDIHRDAFAEFYFPVSFYEQYDNDIAKLESDLTAIIKASLLNGLTWNW